MKLAVLTPNVTALAQPSIDDIQRLAQCGYHSVISNRPDYEAPDQPNWRDIKAAAAANGMDAVHIPVVASQISDEDVAAFGNALKHLPKPIAAFCRTGTRTALMWALANQAGQSVEERIGIAAREGYDLEPFRDRLSREV